MKILLPFLFLLGSLAVGELTSKNPSFGYLTQTQKTQPSRINLSGIWEGDYTCNQGQTQLKLDLRIDALERVKAIFYFSAHPHNPSIPSGSFEMQGFYRRLDAGRAWLSLGGTRWINQPSGYEMVGLSGIIFLDEQRISGDVVYPGCKNFNLRRM
jgi:hypothetical protein